MNETTDVVPDTMLTGVDHRRRGVWFWMLLAAVLIAALYLVSWLATRYDGDGSTTATPTTTTTMAPTDASTTTVEPTTSTTTTDAPATTQSPSTTEPDTTTTITDEPTTIAGLLDPDFFVSDPLRAAGLLDTLDGPGPFLVLAPTTEAFDGIDDVTLARLLNDAEGLLRQTLLHHVVEADIARATLEETGTTLTSLAGERLDFSTDAEGLIVNDTVRVVGDELRASNGIVLGIDSVLVPQAVSTVLTADAISALVALEPILFDDASASIRAESTPTLDRAVDLLASDLDARIEIGGHTDDIGPADGNLRLSLRRAEAVRDYLIAGGVSGDRLVAIGYGQDEPIADNTTAEGRAANRRIEFTPLPAA